MCRTLCGGLRKIIALIWTGTQARRANAECPEKSSSLLVAHYLIRQYRDGIGASKT